jgi:hypothetical protein
LVAKKGSSAGKIQEREMQALFSDSDLIIGKRSFVIVSEGVRSCISLR